MIYLLVAAGVIFIVSSLIELAADINYAIYIEPLWPQLLYVISTFGFFIGSCQLLFVYIKMITSKNPIKYVIYCLLSASITVCLSAFLQVVPNVNFYLQAKTLGVPLWPYIMYVACSTIFSAGCVNFLIYTTSSVYRYLKTGKNNTSLIWMVLCASLFTIGASIELPADIYYVSFHNEEEWPDVGWSLILYPISTSGFIIGSVIFFYVNYTGYKKQSDNELVEKKDVSQNLSRIIQMEGVVDENL